MLKFKMYLADGGISVHAFQVTESNIEQVIRDWKPTATPKLGDYAILLGSGALEIVDETHFGDTYYVYEPPIEISA